LLLLFHSIIKEDFINNLPYVFRGRLSQLKNSKWVNYLKVKYHIVIFSIIVGALIHIFWDGFTHSEGYFVNQLSYAKTTISFLELEIPLYKIFQHSSTVIGGIILLFYFLKRSFKGLKTNHKKYIYWLQIIGITIIYLVFRFRDGISFLRYGDIIASIIGAFIFAIITYATIKKIREQ
tara:strand:- start:1440 stop:1973 length:534 start_codon:yes stop_codon:yes gene_type:complete